MNKVGRPTFNINPDRLRALRKQAGLTQKTLAEPVFSVASLKSVVSDPRTPTNSYQRIERTGKTSEKAARRIAEVLAQKLGQDPDKTLAILCGGQPDPPPDHIDSIEIQLRALLGKGASPLLKRALNRHDDTDKPVRALAVEISTRLEVAQMEQRSEELKALAELTGWTPAELQKPTSLQGYWLLITNTLGHRKTQVLLGVSDVLIQVRTEGSGWFDARTESDVRVELTEDAPWLRVLLQHPSYPSQCKTFSFVRCSPSANGLQWVKPTEWDRWWLDELRSWAFQHTNFVKGFKAEDVWPRDLGCLRLQVQQRVKPENPNTEEDNDRWKSIAVHKGYLDEDEAFQKETRERHRTEGQEHALVTNWLASGLWDEVLLPLLSPIPADWWCIEAWGSGVRISTKNLLSFREMSRYALEPDGRTYFIRLVEETESGDLRAAPWRQRCVEMLVKRLQEDLERCKAQASIDPRKPA